MAPNDPLREVPFLREEQRNTAEKQFTQFTLGDELANGRAGIGVQGFWTPVQKPRANALLGNKRA